MECIINNQFALVQYDKHKVLECKYILFDISCMIMVAVIVSRLVHRQDLFTVALMDRGFQYLYNAIQNNLRFVFSSDDTITMHVLAL